MQMRGVLLTLTAASLQRGGPAGSRPPLEEQPLRAGQPLTLVFQLHNDTQDPVAAARRNWSCRTGWQRPLSSLKKLAALSR